MKIYKIAVLYKAIIFLGALAFSVPAVGMLVTSTEAPFWALIIPLLIMGLVYWLLFYWTLTYTLTITDTDIESKGLFYYRRINLRDIEGFSMRNGSMYLKPRDKKLKTMKVAFHLRHSRELREELADRIVNLDYATVVDEEKNLLQNPAFGKSEMERQKKLDKAKKVSNRINVICIMLTAWVFIFPEYMGPLCIACIFTPWVVLIFYINSKGLIRYAMEGKVYPTLHAGQSVLPAVLMIRVLLTYNFIFTRTLCLLSIGLAVIYFIPIIFRRPEFKLKGGFVGILALLLVSLAYGFSTIIFCNCYIDKSMPATYTTTVCSKYTDGNIFTTYHVQVQPWLVAEGENNIMVNNIQYQKIDSGSRVSISLKHGNLGVPWYYVIE